MKKFYVFTTVFMFIASLAVAQTTYYWVGGDALNKAWNDASNWSLSSGGSGGAGVPNASSIAVFDRNSRVRITQEEVNVGAIHVVNNSNTTIYTDIELEYVTLRLNSTTGYALWVDEGAFLKDSSGIDLMDAFFNMVFLPHTQALIDGTWMFDALPNPGDDFPLSIAHFEVPNSNVYTNRIDINGTLHYSRNCAIIDQASMGTYVFFNSGSTLWMDTNGSNYLRAQYDPNSTIYLTGNVNAGSSHQAGYINYGNFIYDCPDQSVDIQLGWQQVTFWGNVEIRNTNGHNLILCGSVGGGGLRYQTIRGDLTISGNSRVSVTHRSGEAEVVLDIYGDLNVGGLSFNVDSKNDGLNTAGYTLLRLRGDIYHTNGIFTKTSTAFSTSADFTIIEMNGSAPQYINSVNGAWEGNNNDLVLRMNNSNGVYLNSPISIGRLNFETANKGVIYTSPTSVLTISNRSRTPGGRTLRGIGDDAYVQGPVRRRTSSVNSFPFPTGANGKLRVIYIDVQDAQEGIYQAEFVPSTHPDPSVVTPLLGLENGYWNVQTIMGDNTGYATLSINGAVPGAQSFHGLVAAVYNGSDWERAGGEMLAPGNVATGTVTTGFLPVLTGTYAIAYGNQSALPIVLEHFDAKKLNNTTSIVSWKVTRESTPERFEVLKSVNGRDFVTVNTVHSVFGQQSYQVMDDKLGAGTTYYRLKMFDVDGTETLSKIVAVMNGVQGVEISGVMPSVFTNSTRLNISSSDRVNMTLVVTDISGRIVHRQIEGITPGNQDVILNLHSLASGVYNITGYYNGQVTKTVRVVKQ